jgi:hypothetical protein
MNPVLFQTVQERFPDARVGLILGDEVAIVLVRGHMRTIYRPDPKLLEEEYTPELLEKVIAEIWQAHNEVDIFYSPHDYDAGSHAI